MKHIQEGTRSKFLFDIIAFTENIETTRSLEALTDHRRGPTV